MNLYSLFNDLLYSIFQFNFIRHNLKVRKGKNKSNCKIELEEKSNIKKKKTKNDKYENTVQIIINQIYTKKKKLAV